MEYTRTIKAYEDDHSRNQFKVVYADTITELPTEEISRITLNDAIGLSTTRIILADETHPYCVSDFFSKYINISEEYYKKHKEEVDTQIISFIEKLTESQITISESELITPKIIEAIAKNPNIKKAYLGNSREEKCYSLSKEAYDLFKKHKKEKIITYAVDDELEEEFDSLIQYNEYKNLIGSYTYSSITTTSNRNGILHISSPIEKENYRYIKFIPDGITLKLDYPDFHNMLAFIEEVTKSRKDINIEVEVKDYKKKNELVKILAEYQGSYENLDFNVAVAMEESISYKQFLEYEKRLYSLIAPAISLSPFERYLYAYKVTSHFKEYKESDIDKQESRKLYQILDNDYMVCVGYSKLLEDLLAKLGIDSYAYSVTTETTFDNVSKDIVVMPEHLKSSLGHHARRMVNIVDPKYDIDGIYICDPTWDNYMQVDSFCYAALTHTESVQGSRYFEFNTYNGTELLHVTSLEEFYEKINFLINKQQKRNTCTLHKRYKDEIRIMELVLEILLQLDPEFVNNFNKKFNCIRINNQTVSLMTKDYTLYDIQNMFFDMGDYIVNKVNKPLLGETFEKAIFEVYSKAEGLSVDEATAKTSKTMHNTMVITRDKFPKRMKINYDGTEEVYDNEFNKFEEYNLDAKSQNFEK